MNLLDFVQNIPGVKTDKYDLGYFTEVYDRLLTPRKESCKLLLEIGIHTGLSLLLWKEYFLNATIHGIDIFECGTVEHTGRIVPHYDDAYTIDCVKKFQSESFDIVIDDGPHTFESQSFFCKNYLDLVKPGGVMILEDILDKNYISHYIDLIGKKHNIIIFDMYNKGLPSSLWNKELNVLVIEKN